MVFSKIIRFIHFHTRGFRSIFRLTFGILLLFALYDCSTNRAIRMREKNLEEWTPSQKEEREKSGDSERERKVHSKKAADSTFKAYYAFSHGNYPPQNIGGMLSEDFQKLTKFGCSFSQCHLTEEKFSELFWEGATQSLQFFLSSQPMNQSSVNHLIERELLYHTYLGHHLAKPEICKTTAENAFKALNRFTGDWHGRWRKSTVHHLWLPTRAVQKPINEDYLLVGFQSCYTGDGFGWNYVVKEKNHVAILGFVYHFNDTGKIVSRNPHYAFVNTDHQLTWISDTNMYYEFVCDDSSCKQKRHYVITGLDYRTRSKNPEFKMGFQAVYLSDHNFLPRFKSFYLNQSTRAKNYLSKKMVRTLKSMFFD